MRMLSGKIAARRLAVLLDDRGAAVSVLRHTSKEKIVAWGGMEGLSACGAPVPAAIRDLHERARLRGTI